MPTVESEEAYAMYLPSFEQLIADITLSMTCACIAILGCLASKHINDRPEAQQHKFSGAENEQSLAPDVPGIAIELIVCPVSTSTHAIPLS